MSESHHNCGLDDSPEDAARGPALPAHLYLHVPFCASKCDYCDFASVANASQQTVDTVFAALRSQVAAWERTGLEGVLDTIYVGGGTPSLHAQDVVDLLEFVSETLVVHPSAEITVEANPESLTPQAAEMFAQAGVTRISVGVQSFQDHDLRVLGRCHDAQSAFRACETVVASGLSLSLDLMCAIPGQTRTSWAENLQRAVQTGARHISVYPLAVEDGTPLQVAVDTGLVEASDPDFAAELMVLAEEALGYYGFERYEVANYAASRRDRSRHNSAYWSGRAYLGLGPGAHGMLDASTAMVLGYSGLEPGSRVRIAANASIDRWLTGEPDEVEILSAAEAVREDVMLGMRLSDGVPLRQVSKAGLAEVLRSLAQDGLVELHEMNGEQCWRCTRRGWLLGNEVFGRIWNAEWWDTPETG